MIFITHRFDAWQGAIIRPGLHIYVRRKPEIRNSKFEAIPKLKTRKMPKIGLFVRISNFEFVSGFDIRVSDFISVRVEISVN